MLQPGCGRDGITAGGGVPFGPPHRHAFLGHRVYGGTTEAFRRILRGSLPGRGRPDRWH